MIASPISGFFRHLSIPDERLTQLLRSHWSKHRRNGLSLIPQFWGELAHLINPLSLTCNVTCSRGSFASHPPSCSGQDSVSACEHAVVYLCTCIHDFCPCNLSDIIGLSLLSTLHFFFYHESNIESETFSSPRIPQKWDCLARVPGCAPWAPGT